MKPYFYKIKHKATGKIYVGSQYGMKSNPENLLTKYFTSSKLVKTIILKEGNEAFQIVKIVVREDAREYEQQYLIRVYNFLGRDKFLDIFLNRNLSPGILLTEDIIKRANEKRKISNSLAAKKLIEEGRHNFQLHPIVRDEAWSEKTSNRMKGNNYGSMKKITDEMRKNAAEKSKGNTNVRGMKWWYNPVTDTKKRSFVCPGEGWINKCPPKKTLKRNDNGDKEKA